jgi:uncharacterized sulfatase
LTRRDFLQDGTAVFAGSAFLTQTGTEAQARPNLLWITSEDNAPNLGCFGDAYANTPNLDSLAARGMRYPNTWSNAPVCAPARTAIITGMYPTSTGSEHMRSMTRLPSEMKMFPQFLREAGYYCTNNNKEDYNLEKPGQVWDESSNRAHWRNRGPGQPFFAVFNFIETHESQIRSRPHTPVHDPAKVRVPAYHPDHPVVRQDWAQYHDKMTEMDAKAGGILRQLEEDGLQEDTIVFYYGDNGPGMPRSKRWPYNSGLNVPLIVHVPGKYRALAPSGYQPGGSSPRLLSFVDLAPTVLSLVGIQPSGWMHGRAFMGRYEAAPQPYIHGFRGRMDERYDMVRSVRDERYVYIRNFMPHRIYGQYLDYMFQTPTTRVWKELFDQGKLNSVQSAFWRTKPAEELYDLQDDPDETCNLAGSVEYRSILERMRNAQRELAVRIRDVGFLPEDELHRRVKGKTPYELGHDDAVYPLQRLMETANSASSGRREARKELVARLDDSESGVRYWAALGILIGGPDAVSQTSERLSKMLREDESHSVRIVCAEALAAHGRPDDLGECLDYLADAADVAKHGLFLSLAALNAVDQLGLKARPILEVLKKLPTRDPSLPDRLNGYVPRLLDKIVTGLEGAGGA